MKKLAIWAKCSTRRSPRSSSPSETSKADTGRLESVQLVRRYPRSTLALGIALALGLPSVAAAGPEPCDQTATTRTCEGDQSNGVVFVSAPSELNVFNLNTDITPSIGNILRDEAPPWLATTTQGCSADRCAIAAKCAAMLLALAVAGLADVD